MFCYSSFFYIFCEVIRLTDNFINEVSFTRLLRLTFVSTGDICWITLHHPAFLTISEDRKSKHDRLLQNQFIWFLKNVLVFFGGIIPVQLEKNFCVFNDFGEHPW